MNLHGNAHLTPLGRAEMVRRLFVEKRPVARVAAEFGVCAKTVAKWAARFQAEGAAGLLDRRSWPRRLRHPTPLEVAHRAVALRRERWTGKRIAAELGVSTPR